MALEKIRREQQNARQRLVELDLRHQELSALVERATKAIIAPEQEVSQCTGQTRPLVSRLSHQSNRGYWVHTRQVNSGHWVHNPTKC